MSLSVLLCVAAVSLAKQVHEDLIVSLPDTPVLPFNQYSGYLQASTEDKFLHYWFVEAETDSANAPVVVWLNGGPGCSSMDGLFYEHGPLTFDDNGVLQRNQYSWNKLANMLYIEAPVGVGFSFSRNSADYNLDDDKTSLDNYNALLSFFKKFPELLKNKLYITGESYAGIYVPTLAKRIADGNKVAETKLNLVGFAVGNGALDFPRLSESTIYFLYYHGMISEESFNEVLSACCTKKTFGSRCGFTDSDECQRAQYSAQSSIGNINFYDVYRKCAANTNRIVNLAFATKMPHLLSHVFNKVQMEVSGSNGEEVPCIDSGALERYFARKDVQLAIHVRTDLPAWSICSSAIQYSTLYESMMPIFPELVENFQVLIYNGDTDLACNFIGDEWFVSDLKLREVSKRQFWTVANQVAGYEHQYENITYITVKGAGHMVPQWKPEAALQMLSDYLINKQ